MNTRTDETCYHLPGTRLQWRGLRGWLETVHAFNSRFRHSQVYFDRARRLYRCLSRDFLLTSRDEALLAEISALLRESRYNDAPLRYGLGRVFSRSELGALIVEAENHLAWLQRGAPTRTKGPKLEPGRIPDDRLDALIQSHRDLEVVEALRTEKARRLQASE